MDYRERWELKEYLSGKRLGRRVLLFQTAIALLLATYLLGFWNLQIVQGEEYARLAENNRLRRVPLHALRGMIYDRAGEVVASTRPSLSLLLRREGLDDPAPQLRGLADVVGVPYDTLRERYDKMRRQPTFKPFVVKEDVSLVELVRIESRPEWYPDVEVEEAAVRNYPGGSSVAHSVGYVGEVSEAQLARLGEQDVLRAGDIVGQAGVERAYDGTLRGERGWKLVTVNNLGRQLGDGQPGRIPTDGSRLDLTIDMGLQRALLEAYGDEVGAGVFLDPWTGEILALASSPTYDPNLFAGRLSDDVWTAINSDPKRPLLDRAVGSAYAPGSTFKTVMALAGLDSGAVSPSARVHCPGSIQLYGRRFLCWKKGGHGSVDLHDALVHSCNVYFYTLGKTLGIEQIHRYGALLGLGRRSGVDLPGETDGILPSDEWKQGRFREPWYPGETISVSIGQGYLSVTPIQMATAMAAVATDGLLARPHLVRGGASEPVRVPISPGAFAAVRSALADVVETGTGRRASLRNLSVAGKTGTAQVFKRSAGIDADELPKEERDHAWFVGYAPADRPRIAFAVVVEHGGHGGTTAAPIARRVLEEWLLRTDAQPPRESPRKGELRAGLDPQREGAGDAPTAPVR